MSAEETGPADLLERATAAVARHGDLGVVIADATDVLALAADRAELAALRALIASLPDDDWQPFDWAVFSLAQDEARRAVGVES